MSQNSITFTHSGILEIGNARIQCFVGKDNQGKVRRVISGRSLTSAIGMKGRGPGARRRVAKHHKLGPYLPDDLVKAIEEPVEIVGGPGSRRTKPTDGYEATVLHDICQAILDAKDDGALTTAAELRYAQYSEALIRGLAKVGIIALIDEATGYQAERDREELQKLLSMYVNEELRPWVKTFPDDYYRELFRLRGWQYKPLSVKRPQFVGKLTNQIVYERMPPGVLEELEKRNPKNMRGHRTHHHHQHLTEDVGVPHLEKMLTGVTALMRASPNWNMFMRLLNRAYPPNGVRQLELGLDDEDQ